MSIRTAVVSIILALGIIAAAGYAVLREREVPVDIETAAVVVPAEKSVEKEHEEQKAEFRYEVVATPEARAQGLSGRSDVPSRYGMLFVFDEKGSYGFWMKDMLVAIDILWLADDGTILGIDHAVSPSTYPTPFYPPAPVQYVLETRAGEARTQGWYVGKRLALPR